jgi:hypothetical protein
MVQISTVTETTEAHLVPIGEVKVETESSRRERGMRIASRELVRVPPSRVSSSTQNHKAHVAHCMSTVVSSKPRYDHRRDYHLGVHHRLRQRIRCASRNLGGYKSSSESGSSGLSGHSNHEDHDHSPRLGTSGVLGGESRIGFLDEVGVDDAYRSGGGRGLVVPAPS